ncbi:hypothetical protein SH661x_001958 [Planctomicrobium sp. SH661]|uniref:NrdR family transcriptional regulator n=1 Tax=Planctomicrobium sp. SH661 TaxID=3448124 RepID=UPI003F5C8EF7
MKATEHAWCPQCGCPDSHVLKTRKVSFSWQGKPVTRRIRRHECDHCGSRFSTREEVIPGSAPVPSGADLPPT